MDQWTWKEQVDLIKWTKVNTELTLNNPYTVASVTIGRLLDISLH